MHTHTQASILVIFAVGLLINSASAEISKNINLGLENDLAGGSAFVGSGNPSAKNMAPLVCQETQLIPWAISNAGNYGIATNIAQPCDRFDYEPDLSTAWAMWDDIWRVLSTPNTWTARGNPQFTYQYYVDSNYYTNWGRAYRYTGVETSAGPIRTPQAFVGPGTYTAPNGTSFRAMVLQTWDYNWEMIVIIDERNYAHATQHFNGLPIVNFYTY